MPNSGGNGFADTRNNLYYASYAQLIITNLHNLVALSQLSVGLNLH